MEIAYRLFCVRIPLLFLALFLLTAGAANGKSVDGHWLPGDGLPGIDGEIRESIAWDPDGDGPSGSWLIVAGKCDSAGTTIVHNIAAWNGQDWIALGSGLDGVVLALCVYEGDLIASVLVSSPNIPSINRVQRWDGERWLVVGDTFDDTVNALAVFDGQLIAGGSFGYVGKAGAHRLAVWNGTEWSEFAGGVSQTLPSEGPSLK